MRSSPTSASVARTSQSRDELLTRIRQRINPDALVLGDGPEQPGRVAIVSGGAPKHLAEAAAQGYGLYLTGEPAEPSLQLAKELGVTLVAAGHYATEKLGVQALTAKARRPVRPPVGVRRPAEPSLKTSSPGSILRCIMHRPEERDL